MDIMLLKVKLKFWSKDPKRTFSICCRDCFLWAQVPGVTLGTSRLTQSSTAAPLHVEASGVQRSPHYHLPAEARVPFSKLTGATGLLNNKQIHGVVFVKDKGLSLSLRLLKGFGRHSNHLPQIFSVSSTSHISLIWCCHFDISIQLVAIFWRHQKCHWHLCRFHGHVLRLHIGTLLKLLKAGSKLNFTLLLCPPKVKFTSLIQTCTQVCSKTFCKNIVSLLYGYKAKKDFQTQYLNLIMFPNACIL